MKTDERLRDFYNGGWKDPEKLSESAAVPGTPPFMWARKQIMAARRNLPAARRRDPVYIDLASGKALASSAIANDMGLKSLHTLDFADVKPIEPPTGSKLRIFHSRGDVQALPYASKSADIVSSFMGWDMAPNKHQATKELHRIMKPGSRAVILFHRFEGVDHVNQALKEHDIANRYLETWRGYLKGRLPFSRVKEAFGEFKKTELAQNMARKVEDEISMRNALQTLDIEMGTSRADDYKGLDADAYLTHGAPGHEVESALKARERGGSADIVFREPEKYYKQHVSRGVAGTARVIRSNIDALSGQLEASEKRYFKSPKEVREYFKRHGFEVVGKVKPGAHEGYGFWSAVLRKPGGNQSGGAGKRPVARRRK